MNRITILVVTVLIVAAALGAVSAHSLAQTPEPAAPAQGVRAPIHEEAVGPDTDTVEEQVGDQNEVDAVTGQKEADAEIGQNETDTKAQGEEAVGPDTDTVEEQVGDQNEADAVTGQNEADTEVGKNKTDTEAQGSEREAPPTGAPAISAEQAKAAAEAHLNAGTATGVELDDEDGSLVYSVTIGSADVKVDAMTGAVLGVETD